jgi:Tfp pilus assembly protein PilF
VALAGFRSFDSIQAGIAFEQGTTAEQSGQYGLAAKHYLKVVDILPDSTVALAKLAIAEYRAGQIQEARAAVNRLVGRHVSAGLTRELNQAIATFDPEKQAK